MITISISKTELLTHLQAASKIISSKPAIPVMSCFLFEVKDGELTITAADSAGSIKTVVPGINASGDISVCYEDRMLLDSLKTLPEQPITFNIEEATLNTEIKYQGGKFQLVGLAPEIFPRKGNVINQKARDPASCNHCNEPARCESLYLPKIHQEYA